MNDQPLHPAMKGIVEQRTSLTPKARILENDVLFNLNREEQGGNKYE